MMLRSRSASCARFTPAALVILALHACAEGPPVRQTIEPTPAPAPVLDPPTLPPAPVPVPAPAPVLSLPSSNFHLVASTEHEFLLRRLGSKIAVVVDAALAVIDETGELGDIVRPAPDLDSHPLGIGGWYTHTIGGHWPDRTWMIANRTLGSHDFAVFVDLASETGADAPIPALEAFVRDHQEHAATLDAICEVERDGQRRIALFTTYKTSKPELLAALDRAVPGPRHAFWCGRPPVRRCFDKQDGTPTP